MPKRAKRERKRNTENKPKMPCCLGEKQWCSYSVLNNQRNKTKTPTTNKTRETTQKKEIRRV